MEISELKILLKQTIKKAPKKLVDKMKAINTTTEATIINDKVVYSNGKNAVLAMTLLDENESLELIGFSKVELKGKELKLTK